MKMKAKKLLAIIVSVAMTVLVPVQTVWADATQEAGVDEQYPLSRYKDWFAVRHVDGLPDLTMWKWDPMYIGSMKLHRTGDYTVDSKYGHTEMLEYVYRHAIADDDFRYLMGPGGSIQEATVAKLAGVSLVGYTAGITDRADVVALEKELRDFMNSFDWRNATDEEKAVRIAKRIQQADYDHEGAAMDAVTYFDSERKNSGFAYGCLVEGKALCGGYTSTASLLGLCVDLPVSGHGAGNHMYPLYRVNGVWLSNEPTQKSTVFQIFDTTQDYYMAGDIKCFEQVGEYCDRTGYQVPETLDGVIQDMTLSDGTQIYKSIAYYGGKNAPVMQFR